MVAQKLAPLLRGRLITSLKNDITYYNTAPEFRTPPGPCKCSSCYSYSLLFLFLSSLFNVDAGWGLVAGWGLFKLWLTIMARLSPYYLPYCTLRCASGACALPLHETYTLLARSLRLFFTHPYSALSSTVKLSGTIRHCWALSGCRAVELSVKQGMAKMVQPET